MHSTNGGDIVAPKVEAPRAPPVRTACCAASGSPRSARTRRRTFAFPAGIDAVHSLHCTGMNRTGWNTNESLASPKEETLVNITMYRY